MIGQVNAVRSMVLYSLAEQVCLGEKGVGKGGGWESEVEAVNLISSRGSVTFPLSIKCLDTSVSTNYRIATIP